MARPSDPAKPRPAPTVVAPATGKRKHAEMALSPDPEATLARCTFSFDPHAKDDGSASPRSHVAHRFRGLAIEGGVGGARAQADPGGMASLDDAVHGYMAAQSNKRMRIKGPDEVEEEHSKDSESALCTTPKRRATEPTTSSPPESLSSSSPTTADPDGSRARERTATPSPPTSPTDGNERIITDPLRASLTWQDDEITVYDPDDSDDDGTGINGIGFKPTPAIAYARTLKRRRQLAEYRKREEREARMRRMLERRRPSAVPRADMKDKVERRRVRFLEEVTSLIGV